MLHVFFQGATIRNVDGFPYHIKSNGSCVDHIITKKAELERFRDKLWGKFLEDNDFILSTMEAAYRHHVEDVESWRALKGKDHQASSDHELAESYSSYVTSIMRYAAYVYFPLAIESFMERKAREILGKGDKAHFDIVMTPVRENDLVGERNSLLRLANDGSRDLAEHMERYSYLKRKGMFMDFYPESHYIDALERIKHPASDLERIDDEFRKRREAFEQLLDEYSEDSFTQMLFRTVNESVFFRSWRTERVIQSSYYAVSLFKEIAERLGLDSPGDVLFLLPEEVISSLRNGRVADRDVIAQRRDGFVFITSDDGLFMAQGAEAKEIDSRTEFFEKVSDELWGEPAFKGEAKGRVAIIESPEDYRKISSAEILVTHCTTPDMVPHMKGIKAIITDEGGVLSHAAIISREMRIPAVLGTKVATKTLRDNDIVEVDAYTGEIKVIKE
jgi:phosphohistidine swiveling domain-containing protein